MEAKRPFSQLDWLTTAQPVRDYIIYLEKTIFQMQQQLGQLEKRTEKLEVQTKMNSQNSSKPPSSDSPHTEPEQGWQVAQASSQTGLARIGNESHASLVTFCFHLVVGCDVGYLKTGLCQRDCLLREYAFVSQRVC